jgi:hypothetical protein
MSWLPNPKPNPSPNPNPPPTPNTHPQYATRNMAPKHADDERGAARKGVDHSKEENGLLAQANKVRAATAEPGNKEGILNKV